MTLVGEVKDLYRRRLGPPLTPRDCEFLDIAPDRCIPVGRRTTRMTGSVNGSALHSRRFAGRLPRPGRLTCCCRAVGTFFSGEPEPPPAKIRQSRAQRSRAWMVTSTAARRPFDSMTTGLECDQRLRRSLCQVRAQKAEASAGQRPGFRHPRNQFRRQGHRDARLPEPDRLAGRVVRIAGPGGRSGRVRRRRTTGHLRDRPVLTFPGRRLAHPFMTKEK